MTCKKRIVLWQKLFFALLLAVPAFLAAQEELGPRSTDLSATDLSVTALLGAADGLFLAWRPDWPLSVPPDLFYTLPESGASGITVGFEEPKENFAEQAKGEGDGGSGAAGSATGGSGASGNNAAGSAAAGNGAGKTTAGDAGVSAEWQNGRLARFPVLRDSSFTQAASEYDAAGMLVAITGDGLEMAIVESDEEGRPVIVRIRTESGYFFAALEYAPGRVTETWYDERGFPLRVLYTGETGDSVRISYGENGAEAEAREFFFNSYGSVSEINSPAGTWSAQYERRGFPRYLERNLGNGIERYSFQWDEAGRLTRLSARIEDGSSADSRFEYVLDDRGNWIIRREIRMTNLSGRLFPGPGAVVRRRIQYGDGS
ncbi:MAG: hypothetical protein LBP29_03835 [Treponema sp.]|jgi:hypothetical protein|nr:hypothetical protein [Treponema sp.]